MVQLSLLKLRPLSQVDIHLAVEMQQVQAVGKPTQEVQKEPTTGDTPILEQIIHRERMIASFTCSSLQVANVGLSVNLTLECHKPTKPMCAERPSLRVSSSQHNSTRKHGVHLQLVITWPSNCGEALEITTTKWNLLFGTSQTAHPAPLLVSGPTFHGILRKIGPKSQVSLIEICSSVEILTQSAFCSIPITVVLPKECTWMTSFNSAFQRSPTLLLISIVTIQRQDSLHHLPTLFLCTVW